MNNRCAAHSAQTEPVPTCRGCLQARIEELEAEVNKLRPLAEWEGVQSMEIERLDTHIKKLEILKEAVRKALTGCEGEIRGERLMQLNDAYDAVDKE